MTLVTGPSSISFHKRNYSIEKYVTYKPVLQLEYKRLFLKKFGKVKELRKETKFYLLLVISFFCFYLFIVLFLGCSFLNLKAPFEDGKKKTIEEVEGVFEISWRR